MTLQEIFRQAKFNLYDLKIKYDGGAYRECKFGITPREFLRYAKSDFSSESDGNLINCVSNAKRAIDSQIDCTNKIFGINFDERNSIKTFCENFNIASISPQKLRIINAIGIAPAKLIADAREIRNSIEHDYEQPSKSEASNAVDIAELFLIANEYKIKLIENRLDISDRNDKNSNGIKVHYIPDEKNFVLINYAGREEGEKCEVNNNSIHYLYLLRLMNTVKEEFEATRCINLFFEELDLIETDRNVAVKVI